MTGPREESINNARINKPYYSGHWNQPSSCSQPHTWVPQERCWPREAKRGSSARDERSRSRPRRVQCTWPQEDSPSVPIDWGHEGDASQPQAQEPTVKSAVVFPPVEENRRYVAEQNEDPWRVRPRPQRVQPQHRNNRQAGQALIPRVREPVPEWHIREEVRPSLTQAQLEQLLRVYHQLNIDGTYQIGDGLYVLDNVMRERINRWNARPICGRPTFEDWAEAVIARKVSHEFPMDSVIAIHCECCFVSTETQPRTGEPRALWVSIVKQDLTTVYETFIKHPRQGVKRYCDESHGITREFIRYGLSLKMARKQAIEYLGTARYITGADPENQLRHLGFSEDQIKVFRPKIVDICQMYSPRADLSKFSFKCIAYLVSRGNITFPSPNPPTFTAQVAMKLFMLHRERAQGYQPKWGPNAWVARLLMEYCLSGREWPSSLFRSCFGTRYKNIPTWEAQKYANPNFWGSHHPSLEDDPHRNEPLIERVRPDIANVVPNDWGWDPVAEPERGRRDSVQEPNESIQAMPDDQATGHNEQGMEIGNQQVPDLVPSGIQDEGSNVSSSHPTQVNNKVREGTTPSNTDCAASPDMGSESTDYAELYQELTYGEHNPDEDDALLRKFLPVDELLYGTSVEQVVGQPHTEAAAGDHCDSQPQPINDTDQQPDVPMAEGSEPYAPVTEPISEGDSITSGSDPVQAPTEAAGIVMEKDGMPPLN